MKVSVKVNTPPREQPPSTYDLLGLSEAAVVELRKLVGETVGGGPLQEMYDRLDEVLDEMGLL